MRHLGARFVLGILTLLALAVDCWSASKPNILLITLDAVRADRMGFLGSHAGITPNLDRLAHDSVVFSNAYAQSPVNISSEATILTGAYPQTHRASELAVPLPPALSYLPDLLHKAGYNTAAFVGSPDLDARNGPFQGYDRGFDVYDVPLYQPQGAEDPHRSSARPNEEVLGRSIQWIAATKQRPLFLWVNLHDADSGRPSYDRAVAAADVTVGKLLNALRSHSLYDDTIILLASPYGQSLGAHGEDTHGMFLYDETIHVPLMIKLSRNASAAKQVRNRARLVDIAPTLLEQSGIPVPPQMQGQSLLRIAQASSQSDQPAYSRTDLPSQYFGCAAIESWRAGKYLYIRAPKPELYDLSTDPGAAHNLAQSSKATLDTLASQLQAFDSRLGNQGNTAAGAGLTSSEMQKLSSLGYVGLQKSGAGVNAATQGSDPKDVIAFANKTLAAFRDVGEGNTERATAALKPLIPQQPNSYLVQYVMGIALFQQQQYAGTVPYLHKAIELQPDSAWAQYTMGLVLIKTRDFKTAAVHLELAAARLPAFAAVHTALAEAKSKSK